MMKNKNYSDLILLNTFDERLNYLKLDGVVSDTTFGSHRYLNQVLYNSKEWERFRREIIIRDGGCDLAIEDRPISKNILIHHINPLTIEDIQRRSRKIFDPENVICTTKVTHNAIHYGSDISNLYDFKEREPNDTCPWR